MNTNPKLENYLSRLDRALAPLSVSDRAEILIEIKSHVLSSMERDAGQSVDDLLAALGEPEVVANKYLMERGKAPVKPPISPAVKWIVMGFLGTLALLLLFVGTLLFRFSPLLQVDEKTNHVRLLGGLIDIDGEVKINDRSERVRLEGFHEMNSNGMKSKTPDGKSAGIEVHFMNGDFHLETSADTQFRWNCEARKKADIQPSINEGVLLLDFSGLPGIDCTLRVPRGIEFRISGTNGDMNVEKPRFHLDAKLVNGEISIVPAPGVKYQTRFELVNGGAAGFDSPDFHSNDTRAFRLSAKMTNGSIEREE